MGATGDSDEWVEACSGSSPNPLNPESSENTPLRIRGVLLNARGLDARMNAESEETFSSMLLEDLKQRLLQAFRGQGPGGASSPQLLRPAAREGRGKRTVSVQEELHKAYLEGTIVWLRGELLEMKSQNRKLAQTLLDLSTEIQRLRHEGDMSAALESKTLSIAASPE
ncbi:alanine and arginine-rich domain-containing protein-like isoform X2 [Hemicordylus capensis]|uniref:alanine and arginine-rich domain-containing protein-like isoform X2 n=1 Tax=Hemicordylus capensis TaxID=884348 RepID=UPI00230308CD|nr:alanine and arginine-rich domain-containing protein-like isoform X2 [Hemicordylus capensis]